MLLANLLLSFGFFSNSNIIETEVILKPVESLTSGRSMLNDDFSFEQRNETYFSFTGFMDSRQLEELDLSHQGRPLLFSKKL